MKTLEEIPDSARLTEADFKQAEALLDKLLLAPDTTPKGQRVTTPEHFQLHWEYVHLIQVAKRIKGDSKRFPTVGECRAHQRNEEAARRQQ